MKKSILTTIILILTLMFTSCKKEDVQPNNTSVTSGSTYKLNVDNSNGGGIYVYAYYTDMQGIYHNYEALNASTGYTNVDSSKPVSISGNTYITLYGTNGSQQYITTTATYTLIIDGNFHEIKTTNNYSYSN
jgi:hypothetical protein